MITSRPFASFELSTRLRARHRVRQAVLFAVAVAIALPGLPASASLGTDDLAKFSGLLSGTVYEDQDASQSMNAGDSGIAGVTVVLYDVANDSPAADFNRRPR